MRNKVKFIITLLVFIMTFVTFSLGVMMYYSNLKKTEQNVIGVELADFIYNINYSMQFGKKIETFYGMEQQLHSVTETFENIQDLYIISAENQILFATSVQLPEKNVCVMTPGENKTLGMNLYCMYQLSENAAILVKSDMETIKEKMTAYIRKFVGFALAGVAVVNLLVIFFWNILKSEKNAFHASFILLVVWIMLFGSFIGFGGYQAYCDSLNTVFEAIRCSVRADFSQMTALGVPEDQIYETEQYLSRYTDMIPEVEQIQLEHAEVICIASDSYRKKVILDYTLQTVLLLTFSVLILTEYRLFLFNWQQTNEKEKQEGTV